MFGFPFAVPHFLAREKWGQPLGALGFTGCFWVRVRTGSGIRAAHLGFFEIMKTDCARSIEKGVPGAV